MSGSRPTFVESQSAQRLLAARFHGARPDELHAVASAWRASSPAWIERIFTPAANDEIEFTAHFSGFPDIGGFIEFNRSLPGRVGKDDASTLSGYVRDMVDALWIGANPLEIPDPWSAADLEPLHPSLALELDAVRPREDAWPRQ